VTIIKRKKKKKRSDYIEVIILTEIELFRIEKKLYMMFLENEEILKSILEKRI